MFTLAIFLNILDEHIYIIPLESLELHNIFDLNTILLVEQYHNCYVCVTFNVIKWYFENYKFSYSNDKKNNIDAYQFLLVPFTAYITCNIIEYNMHAEFLGHSKLSIYKKVQLQVKSAIYSFQYMQSAYMTQLNDNHKEKYDPENSSDDGQSIFTAKCDLNT